MNRRNLLTGGLLGAAFFLFKSKREMIGWLVVKTTKPTPNTMRTFTEFFIDGQDYDFGVTDLDTSNPRKLSAEEAAKFVCERDKRSILFGEIVSIKASPIYA